MKLAPLLLLPILLVARKQPDVPAPGAFWKRLPLPRTGDWLEVFPEEGQTFEEYRRADPVRGDKTRRRIYLQPWLTRPAHDPAMIERVAILLGAWFGREVVRLSAAPMPRRAYLPKQRSYSVEGLAARLIRVLPEDALFLLAITDRELTMKTLAFAYGWGSLEHRVGVLTTKRLEVGRDRRLHRRRLMTLAVHESGHMLSMAHCTFYRCLMNGARTLGQADERPFLLCPVCRAKLCWNLGLDPLDRYKRLISAMKSIDLPEESPRFSQAAAVTEETTDS